MQLAARHGLRGYDAIQLACATDLARSAAEVGDAVSVWSSDSELLAAAEAEGLKTVNPASVSASG
jgi:predicted nucleic acid-binding protein